MAKNPTDLKAWVALGADLICTFIPFATGGGIAVRAASKVDDVIDAGRAMNKAGNISKLNVTKSIGNDASELAPNVVRISGYTRHGLEQAIARNGVGVEPKAILDAIKNPKRIVTKTDEFGRISTQYKGKMATVVLNPEMKVVSCWAKSSKYWRIKV